MALTIGVDTYIDVAGADLYIRSHYLSTSPERIAWVALEEEDKEVLLRLGAQNIDSLPLTGRKFDENQKMAFPRRRSFRNDCCIFEVSSGENTVPNEVLYAQVEQALFLKSSTEDASSATRAQLQRQGVKSFSLGDLSESYGDAVVGVQGDLLRQCSEKSLRLLNPWLSGGYKVCS